MANLSRTKTLFAFTSPRTIEKIIPEIQLLTEEFSGEVWSGNSELQKHFFELLFRSEFYEGTSFPADPAFAARDRITRAPKALGFVDLDPEIQLTDAGKLLLTGKRQDETFSRQLLKLQFPSPYHTNFPSEFFVRPYLELIRLINDVGSLSKLEIAIFFTQLTHIKKYDSVIKKIINFREALKKEKGNKKAFIHKVFKEEVTEIFADDIANRETKTRESADGSLEKFLRTKMRNMVDYSDAFMRYIRSTQLVTFEPRTLRMIISPSKRKEVDFILAETPREPLKFKSEGEFKTYLFNPFSIRLLSDNKDLIAGKLVDLGVKEDLSALPTETLKDILEKTEEEIRSAVLEESKAELKNYSKLKEILEVFSQISKREIPDPSLFLEWNVWRALVMLNFATRIDGNFTIDLDGMPLTTAPGRKPDIEADYGNFALISEVTMSSGDTQYIMEGEPVPRHFGRAKEDYNKEVYCLFIAPTISKGTLAHYFNLNRINTKSYGGKTKIIPLTISQFVQFVNCAVNSKFSDSRKLQDWLEQMWVENQSEEDEFTWAKTIDDSIAKWVA